MTEGPWYACRKVPTVHHTMGGIKINVKSQVINTKGKVIPGLYAVGEVTGCTATAVQPYFCPAEFP